MEAGTESTTAAGNGRSASTLSEIATREGFLETSDPALQESADRGKANLLSYTELYELWERQQWRTQDLDFSRDRADWTERIEPEERFQRMYGLSAFFIGEQRVTDELGPIMRAAPTEEQRIFLSTQIADEARHVQFFNRFYEEVGVLEGADDLADRLRATEEHLNEGFGELFDKMLKERVDRLAAEPRGHRAAGRVRDALPHDHRGGPGAHRPALHHRVQRRSRGRCPASSRASRTWRATSIATSRSAFDSSPTWPSRTSATARPSSA